MPWPAGRSCARCRPGVQILRCSDSAGKRPGHVPTQLPARSLRPCEKGILPQRKRLNLAIQQLPCLQMSGWPAAVSPMHRACMQPSHRAHHYQIPDPPVQPQKPGWPELTGGHELASSCSLLLPSEVSSYILLGGCRIRASAVGRSCRSSFFSTASLVGPVH